MTKSLSRIAVVGSLNVDLVATVGHLPRPGETLAADGYTIGRGGKGANQALAAARQHARVALIGCVGKEEAGREYHAFLRDEGLDVSGLNMLPGARTGTAMIAVDARGENQIILASGANARLTAAMVRRHAPLIEKAGAVLLQFEIPLAAIRAAIEIAASAGVRVVLNPSPWRDDFPWGRLPLSTVIVNELEAMQLCQLRPGSFASHRPAIRRRLTQLRVQELVITRGRQPTLCFLPDRVFSVPTLRVQSVDTVGAGDTFAGALTVRLAEGASLEEAVRGANCAGALATLKTGAQASIPSRAATNRAALALAATRELKC